jgi:hypothetical protein
MGALLRDKGVSNRIVGDDFARRAKIANALLKLPTGSGLDTTHIDKLSRFISSFEELDIYAGQINIADAARSAGLIDVYDTLPGAFKRRGPSLGHRTKPICGGR